MSHSYASFCQDFYVNLRLSTQLNLPHTRETLLHFFERLQKEFPALLNFRKCDNGDFNLEEDRRTGVYRWVRLEAKRLVAGFVNPPTLDDALAFHTFVLELAPHYLGISPLEIEHMEALFGFDLSFRGNHDEVVIESLFDGSPLGCLLDEEGARPVDVQPSVAVALSDDCRLQARLDVITRTDNYQVRTGDYSEEELSLYLTVRRYWGDRPKESLDAVFAHIFDRADGLCSAHVVPKVLKPISTAIASRS